MAWKYPVPPRDDSSSQVYKSKVHGEVTIEDPFLPLEEAQSDVTQKWVNEQVNLFDDYFNGTGKTDYRETFNKKLLDNSNYEKVGCPARRKAKLFFSRNDGLQNQSVIYKTNYYPNPADNAKSIQEATVLIDPNTLSTDGTTSVSFTNYDDNGKYLAYGVNRSASDWTTIHVLEVDSGKVLPDELHYCKFTHATWLPDGSGFFYSRYPEPKTLTEDQKTDTENTKLGSETEKVEFHKVYFHKLGTAQVDDILIYEDKDHPNWMFGASLTDDHKYLMISVSESTKEVCQWYYAQIYENGNLQDLKNLKIVKFVDNFDATYDYITNNETVFYFRTNLKAPNAKVIKLDITSSKQDGKIVFEEIVAERKDVLNYAFVVNENLLILNYTVHVKEIIEAYDLASAKFIKEIPLPGIGSIGSLTGRREYPDLFFYFSSFTTPGIIMRYNVPSDSSTVFYKTNIGLDLADVETKQVFYKSKDGTDVPMFITHRKGIVLDGTNPVWLYGYGGFNISFTPYFSIRNVFFVTHFKNAVFALANIRGGGEYGETWHEAGILDKKQNVFDDFINAAEYLVANKYTKPKLITIEGGSNGGLLVAAVMLQRPDLFGAVVCHVGVLDMLKYHKFTIGWAWKSDYGCSDNPEDFDYLIKYSPLHNVKANGQYPSTLVLTSDHDDRVVPLHSFKFVAALQTLNPDNANPLLIRIETKAGHGAGVALTKQIKSYADVFSFVANELKLEYLTSL